MRDALLLLCEWDKAHYFLEDSQAVPALPSDRRSTKMKKWDLWKLVA